MLSEIKRKLFHLIGLIYVAGVLFLPRKYFVLIVAGLFVGDAIMEISRLRMPSVRTFVHSHFGGLFRESEVSRLTGIYWMLLGVLVTALLIPSNRMAATVYLYVIFGDGIASLAGKFLRGPHWPNSDKRLSGSLACLSVCLLIGALVLRPEFSWIGIIGGALVATALEYGFIPLNDNFTIPAGSSLALLIFYQLKPAFLGL